MEHTITLLAENASAVYGLNHLYKERKLQSFEQGYGNASQCDDRDENPCLIVSEHKIEDGTEGYHGG